MRPRTDAGLEIFQTKIVSDTRFQIDRARALNGSCVGPTVDDELAVYPELRAVIRVHVEGVRLGIFRLDLASPDDGIKVGSHRWNRRAHAPFKIDRWVDARQHQAGEAFRARYVSFLRKIAALPGVTRISLNDEGFLLSGCYCKTCRKD